MSDNTNRFALLEIDAPKPAVATVGNTPYSQLPPGTPHYLMHTAPDTPIAALPAIIGSIKGESSARNGALDTDGRARAIAVDSALQAHGLAFNEPTFFAWGTRGQWGDKAAQAREELHRMPLHSELAEQARAIVAKEGRRGDIVDLAALTYGADDRVRTRAGSNGAPCSPQALRQIMARADAPGATYLCDARLPGTLRASHVSHWLGLRNTAEKAAQEAARVNGGKAIGSQAIKLLSKLDGNGSRALYGAVGPKYPHEYGMDRVISDVQAMFPGEARGTLTYDSASTRWRVDACVGAEFEPVVGDVYRMGLRYGAHDAGGGSYYADLYGIRVRCVNFTKIHGLKRLGRVRHVGSLTDLQARVRDLIEIGADAVSAYAGAVREANESAICERALSGDGDARAVFAALISGGYLPAPGGPEAAAEAYFNAWAVEPGHTRLDFVNAATRAAHEGSWSSPWVTEEIEESAGQLLYQRVIFTDAQLGA